MPSQSTEFPIWRIIYTDLVVVLATTLGVQFFWRASGTTVLGALHLPGKLLPTYTLISLLIVALWMLALWLSGSWKQSNLGSGTIEYSLVARASVLTFVVIALTSYLLKAQLARGYVLLAMPIGLTLLLLSRWAWRKYLIRNRQNGNYCKAAVVVGTARSVSQVCERLEADAASGLSVVGAFLSRHTIPLSESQQLVMPGNSVPILGGVNDLIPVIRSRHIDSVIIANTDDLSPSDVRKLGWQLLPSNENLYLAANVVDIAGPRLAIRPVAGIPLIEVQQPQLNAINLLMKRLIDIVISIFAIVVCLPLFVVAAIQIRSFDRQAIFFVQERVGLKGTIFKMIKFRTMTVGAEKELNSLDTTDHDSAGNTILFKLRDDPRVTKPGRWMRRYSVDELPQLFNVLLGHMSMVGPRPPLAREVDSYDEYVTARFIVKPGITGLWQISGRSDLSWEESVRADLSYVQNWSIMADFTIMWRTIKAVFVGKGAY